MDKKRTNNPDMIYRMEHFLSMYKIPIWIGLAVFLMVLPHLMSQYLLTVTIKICAYICLALGLNILTGYTGLVSLGHAGFVAIGAYTSSLLMVKLGVNFFPATLAGILLAGIVGVLLGLPTLRVSGTYLSIITLGFGEIVKMVAMNWSGVTNGTLGVKNIPKPQILGLTLTVSNKGMYYLAIALVFFVSLFCYVLVKSKIGRGIQAVKGDELAAVMMGISTFRYKILAFVISAAICAMGGSLYASLIGYVDPNTFNFDVSTLILSIVILGGMGTLRGMFIGAILLIAVPEASRFLMEYRFVLYGVVLLLMMRFRPQGILGWKSSMPYALSKNVAARLRQEENTDDGIHPKEQAL